MKKDAAKPRGVSPKTKPNSTAKPKTTRGKSANASKDKNFEKPEKLYKVKPEYTPSKYPKKKSTATEKISDGSIRLNKYLSDAGIASRRQADELIKSGLVEVNGIIIEEMGYKVQPTDQVRYDDKILKAEKNVYVVLNKPKGFITTTKDEKERKTVMDLVQNSCPFRIYPVGQLDRQTTGVLLFTNDGQMAKKLTDPTRNVRKIYHIKLDKNVTMNDLEKLREGIRLFEGIAKVDHVSHIPNAPKNEVGIEIHIGWTRVVRRLFEGMGYKIETLDRVSYAGLTKKNIKRGQWKILTQEEVNFLLMV